MEDFGYKKNNESDKNPFLAKKIFLISATLLSLSAFSYISLNAYYFINQNNKEIETIKGPDSPIKIYEESDYNDKNNDRVVNRLIYDDIFGNRKEIIREDIRINKNIEPAYPPKKQNETLNNKALENIQNSNTDSEINSTNNNSSPENSEKNAEIINDKKLKNEIKPVENQSTTLQNKNIKTQPIIRKKSAIKVQISAMSSKENCEEYFNKLKKLYPEALSGVKYYIEEADLGRRGIFYRLQLGDFFNQVDAEEFCEKFISQTQKSRSECIIVE